MYAFIGHISLFNRFVDLCDCPSILLATTFKNKGVLWREKKMWVPSQRAKFKYWGGKKKKKKKAVDCPRWEENEGGWRGGKGQKEEGIFPSPTPPHPLPNNPLKSVFIFYTFIWYCFFTPLPTMCEVFFLFQKLRQSPLHTRPAGGGGG